MAVETGGSNVVDHLTRERSGILHRFFEEDLERMATDEALQDARRKLPWEIR